LTTLSRREALAAMVAAAGAAGVTGCVLPPRLAPLSADQAPPPAPREFRGAWVATVANIDWPSAPGLPEAEQRAQLQRIVARAAALGLNALIVQVRPACDALYASALEPASEYVSGTQGLAPGYDPLARWVEAAHAHGLELHAWFNPFRARHPSAKSPLAASHIATREPAWVKAYGETLWLDPGEPGAVAHTLAVIDDVVRRYDIDGVHIDDYFYPYPVKGPDGHELAFPDEASFARAGTALSRDDWRRDNVNRFVRALYERVHAAKPWVKVGISPFALPRRERRQGAASAIEGFDPHARLYADAELWLEQGWLDYIAPQLYWPMAQRAQAFDVLLDHWAATNIHGRHLWPGLFTSRVALPPNPWPADEVVNQLAHLRAQSGKAGGHIHFSMVALLDDRGGVASRLLAAPAMPALVPASPWLGRSAPARPRVAAERDAVLVAAEAAGEDARWLVLWRRSGGRWRLSLHDATAVLRLPWTGVEGATLEALTVSAITRSGVESERVSLAVLKQD
jgi:uncharacterized lipoprotein YddW (UPF0748 family)